MRAATLGPDVTGSTSPVVGRNPVTRTSRPRALAALALAGALTLSACGASDEDEAAAGGSGATAVVSGDETYTVGEVQTATTQVNTFLSQGQQAQELTPEEVSHYLAYADEYATFGTDVLAEVPALAQQNFTVPSDGIIERAFGEIEVTPTQESVQVLKAYVVGSVVQQAQLPESAELEAELAAKDVSFSPRYAEQDPAWLEVTEEPAGDPGLTEMPTQ